MTDVDIMNIAAVKLGTNTINTRLDQSTTAIVFNARYEAVRDAELRRNLWRFAIKRTELSALTSTPLGTQFTTEFQLPSDYLRLVQVAESFVSSQTNYRTVDESLYSIEGKKLLTNWPSPLLIRYVYRVTDTSVFDTTFREVLGARLAYECCETIVGRSSKKGDIWKDYQQASDEARPANAIEVYPQVQPDESWLMARIDR